MKLGRRINPEEREQLFPVKPKADGLAQYKQLLEGLQAGEERMIELDPKEKEKGAKLVLGRAATALGKKLAYGTIQTDAQGNRFLPISVSTYEASPPPDTNRPKRPGRPPKDKTKAQEPTVS